MRKTENFIKQERGAIALYVLLACLFFTFVLSGAYISNLNKLQIQEKQLQQIQENYARDLENLEQYVE